MHGPDVGPFMHGPDVGPISIIVLSWSAKSASFHCLSH